MEPPSSPAQGASHQQRDKKRFLDRSSEVNNSNLLCLKFTNFEHAVSIGTCQSDILQTEEVLSQALSLTKTFASTQSLSTLPDCSPTYKSCGLKHFFKSDEWRCTKKLVTMHRKEKLSGRIILNIQYFTTDSSIVWNNVYIFNWYLNTVFVFLFSEVALTSTGTWGVMGQTVGMVLECFISTM